MKHTENHIAPSVGKQFPFRMSDVTMTDREGYLVRPHWHEHLELIKVKQGTMDVIINDQSFEVGPDDIIYVGSAHVHSVQIRSENPGRIIAMIFDPYFVTNLLEGFETRHTYELFVADSNQQQLFHPEHELWDVLNECIETSYIENKQREICFEMAVKSCIYRLTTSLVRHYMKHTTGMLQSVQQLQQLRPVLDFIQQNYDRSISLDELALLANRSRYHFSRYFKKTTGMTVTRFITLTRINVAKRLLSDHQLSITEIADRTGFCNLHYFGNVFKENTGMSPLYFRNEVTHHNNEG